MTELKEKEIKSWLYFENNYSIIKTSIPFIGIGSDHGCHGTGK